MTAIDGTAIIQPTDGEGLTLQWKQEKILQGDGNKNGQASLIPSLIQEIFVQSQLCQALKQWIGYQERTRKLSRIMPRFLALMTQDTAALIN